MATDLSGNQRDQGRVQNHVLVNVAIIWVVLTGLSRFTKLLNIDGHYTERMFFHMNPVWVSVFPLTVSGVMDLRSWCFPGTRGRQYGLLKSPIRSGWSSPRLRADLIKASDWLLCNLLQAGIWMQQFVNFWPGMYSGFCCCCLDSGLDSGGPVDSQCVGVIPFHARF